MKKVDGPWLMVDGKALDCGFRIAGCGLGLVAVVAFAVLFGGCASPARRVISVEPVRARVVDSQVAVAQSRASIKVAKSAVEAARGDVRELLRVAPVDLRPQVEALETKLVTANQELVIAESRAETATQMLTEARVKTDLLQQDVDRESGKLVAMQGRLEAALKDRNALWWAVWRWRGLCAGMVALVAVLWWARAQFPFLRILLP